MKNITSKHLLLFLIGSMFFLLQPNTAFAANTNIETYTSSSSFTVPSGVSSIEVLVVGAGGSGGIGVLSSHTRGGGGGGGQVVSQNLAVSQGQNFQVVVGQPGGSSSIRVSKFGNIVANGGSWGSSGQSNCYCGSGGSGYSGSTLVSGSAGGQTCFGVGGDGGGVATSNSITGFTTLYGGGGTGAGGGANPGSNGAGAFGFGAKGSDWTASTAAPGGPGVVIVKWTTYSSEKSFDSFSTSIPNEQVTIDNSNHEIQIRVPSGTSLSSIVPTFSVSAGSSVNYSGSPLSTGNTSINLSNPISLTVIAEDNSSNTWQVVAIVLPRLSTPNSQTTVPAQSSQEPTIQETSKVREQSPTFNSETTSSTESSPTSTPTLTATDNPSLSEAEKQSTPQHSESSNASIPIIAFGIISLGAVGIFAFKYSAEIARVSNRLLKIFGKS